MAERRERGRASDPDACDEQLTEYLGGDGGDIADRVDEAFGTVDPFRRMVNGLRTVTEALALVSTDPSDYPPAGGDLLGVSAIMLGRLVAKSNLSASDRNDLQDFMSLTRPDVMAHYANGIKSGAAELGESGELMLPNEARRVLEDTGMEWVESLACIFAMATFRVPTARELKALGHGVDPVTWTGFKNSKKLGLKTFLDYKEPKDAPRLRDDLRKAARLLQTAGWMTAAATVRSFVDDLSEMTFDEGVPGYFVDFYVEYMDLHRSRGLIANAPLDPDILRRKVLGRRSGSTSCEDASRASARVAQEEQVAELTKEARRAQSQIASLKDEISKLKTSNKGDGREQASRPGEDQKCYECGSPDHFGYNCEIRKKRLAKEAAEKEKRDETKSQ